MFKNRKLIQRIFSSIVALAVAFTLFPTISVNAEENKLSAPTDFGSPISVTTYTDNDGSVITERIYFYSDSASTLRDKSGSGWYKNEKTKEWSDGTTTYYAQGYFVWGDGEVSVSSPSGGASDVKGITLSNKNLSSGTGKYGYLFNNYAYVTYSFKATNIVGLSDNYSVTIRISESGNAI
ncbi:MAG: hypothetical protein K2O65_02990 [Lachnospiraceae bacterium]|nr:hypothetical protein [Lachnospiraceae bacterium]